VLTWLQKYRSLGSPRFWQHTVVSGSGTVCVTAL